MSFDQFKDAVAIVTGGGSGIGRALCEEVSKSGAIAVVADVNDENARNAAASIVQRGGQARPKHVDVSSQEDMKQLIDTTISELGRLDFIFNNAGIALFGDARDLTLEQWRRVLDVNLNGVLYGTVFAYSVMVKQGFGHIVNVASSAGLSPAPTEAAYCTSKYGVVGLSLSLRPEAADLGVKVSVVCPGYVRTSILQSATVLNVPAEQRGAMTPPTLKEASKSAPLILNPRTLMEPIKAAHIILKGVSRNRAIIAFPTDVLIGWLLYRLSPGLMDRMLLLAARDFRKYRTKPVGAIGQ